MDKLSSNKTEWLAECLKLIIISLCLFGNCLFKRRVYGMVAGDYRSMDLLSVPPSKYLRKFINNGLYSNQCKHGPNTVPEVQW